jgi:hypothetical protein
VVLVLVLLLLLVLLLVVVLLLLVVVVVVVVLLVLVRVRVLVPALQGCHHPILPEVPTSTLKNCGLVYAITRVAWVQLGRDASCRVREQ